MNQLWTLVAVILHEVVRGFSASYRKSVVPSEACSCDCPLDLGACPTTACPAVCPLEVVCKGDHAEAVVAVREAMDELLAAISDSKDSEDSSSTGAFVLLLVILVLGTALVTASVCYCCGAISRSHVSRITTPRRRGGGVLE